MPVFTSSIHIFTDGFCDIHNLSAQVESGLKGTKLRHGVAVIFAPGATAAITTIEFESGALKDFEAAIQKFAPEGIHYHHDSRWHDGNGFSHVRAAFLGPSVSVPFDAGKLLLGTWQQIILVDFDNRPRHREVIFQFIGN